MTLRRARACAVLLSLPFAASLPTVAGATEVKRSGFTVQVAMGLGAFDVVAREAPARGAASGPANSGFLLVGGFLNPTVALGVSLTIFGGQMHSNGALVFGPAAQFWLGDRFSVVGALGVGMAGFTTGPHVDEPFTQGARGLGMTAGVFARVLGGERHSMQVGALYSATLGSDPSAPFGLALLLAYQYH